MNQLKLKTTLVAKKIESRCTLHCWVCLFELKIN